MPLSASESLAAMMMYKFTNVLKMTLTKRKVHNKGEESSLILALIGAISNLVRAEHAKSEGGIDSASDDGPNSIGYRVELSFWTK
jgi:hypothetical protein